MNFKSLFTKQNIQIGLLWVGLFIFGFVSSYLGLSYFKVFAKKTLPQINTSRNTLNPIAKATPADVQDQKGVFNILLLGYGGAGHSGSNLTDSLIVVHLDTNKKQANLVSVPRDLWVPGNQKINAAVVTIGFQNVPGVVQNVTGLPMMYFVAVDFSGFSKIVDTLGGISVDVPKTFDDNFYPVAGRENETCGFTADEINTFKAKYTGFNLEKQFPCRYEQLHFVKGSTTLDGATALKFVRSRHGDSDFGRSQRQGAVLKGILNKLISKDALKSSSPILDTLLKMVKTNLTSGVIKSILDIVIDPGSYQVSHTQLTTENVLNESKSSDGQYILVPKAGSFNFAEIRNFINTNIN